MLYSDKFYYVCRVPLSAESHHDVEIVDVAESTDGFPDLFKKYEELRAHAFNKDQLYSVVRADELFALVRTTGKNEAKELAFEESRANIITNLQHRVMQNNDENARQILRKVHEVETGFGSG